MKLYLFDIDGTLLLSGGAGRKALERVFFDRFGCAAAMEGIEPNGRTDPWIVERMLEGLGRTADAAETRAILAEYEQALAEEVARAERYRLMPGAEAALRRLADRHACMGLATGNTERGARIKLERGALWRYFAPRSDTTPIGGYGSDSHDRPTLVRIAIERARQRLGGRLDPAEVLVIGDTPHDISAARAVGAKVAAVATGGHSLEELAGADEVYPSLMEMVPTL